MIQQGQTASFTGTITNTSTQAQPADTGTFLSYGLGYPNGGAFSGAFDVDKFTYAAGESYTGPLFSIFTTANAPIGTYIYPKDFTSFGINEQGNGKIYYETRAGYTLTVTPAPEPSPSAALGLGMLGLAGLAVTARRRKALSPERGAFKTRIPTGFISRSIHGTRS